MYNELFTIKRGSVETDLSVSSVQRYDDVGKVYVSYSPTSSVSFEYGASVAGETRRFDYTILETGITIKIGDVLEGTNITLRVLTVNEFTGDVYTVQGVAEAVE